MPLLPDGCRRDEMPVALSQDDLRISEERISGVQLPYMFAVRGREEGGCPESGEPKHFLLELNCKKRFVFNHEAFSFIFPTSNDLQLDIFNFI